MTLVILYVGTGLSFIKQEIVNKTKGLVDTQAKDSKRLSTRKKGCEILKDLLNNIKNKKDFPPE